MVTKKKAPARARRRAPRTAAKKTHHTKSGVTYIPAAAATVGLAVANAPFIKREINRVQSQGIKKAAINLMKNDYKELMNVETVTSSALGIAGGYIGGELVRKFAPGFIKTPLGKIAKKIPRII